MGITQDKYPNLRQSNQLSNGWTTEILVFNTVLPSITGRMLTYLQELKNMLT